MIKKNRYLILLIFQFAIIIILLAKSYDNEQIVKLEKKIEELASQNQETKNLLLSLKIKFDAVKLTEFSKSDDSFEVTEHSSLTNKKITILLKKEIEKFISDKIVMLNDDVMNNTNSIAKLISNYQIPVVDTNKNYIDKQYESIGDENFKANLILTDEIIERAFSAGEFTEWDAEELNNATQALDFDSKTFIMNKLSHAYNSQKIKGKFIKFELVNRSSEN